MKFLFHSLVGIFFCLLSFSASAQDGGPLRCYIHIQQFNFHRPKTDCKRGFSLCIRFHYDAPIEMIGNGKSCILGFIFGPDEPRVEKNEVYAGVALQPDKLTLILPQEIMELKDYAGEDFSVLPITEKIDVTAKDGFKATILPQKAKLKTHDKYLVYELLLTK